MEGSSKWHGLSTPCIAVAKEEDHSDADCFVCVLLTHGKEGRVYGTDGMVSLDTLTNYFKADECPSLARKPKLFFIQVSHSQWQHVDTAFVGLDSWYFNYEAFSFQRWKQNKSKNKKSLIGNNE